MEKRYRQDLKVAYQVIDGSAFLVQPRDHTMHRLDEAGTLMWEAMARPATASELAGRIVETYDVDAETARTDVLEVLREMEEKGLILRISK